MMMQNYQQIVEKISKSSGVSIEDIERKIEAKRAKLSGLISREGAAQVVAAELGVNFEKEKMKISELLSGMKKINVTGKIIRIFPVREFNKNGRSGKVANFIIADDTSNTKVVLWDTNHIDLIEKNKIKEGDVIDLLNSNVRDTEIHLNGFSDIKISNESFGNVKSEAVFHEAPIKDLKQGQNIHLRAFIVQMFEPKFFVVCPACSKKLSETGECQEHGKVSGDKRALLNVVLDDGTGTIRAVLFMEAIEKMIPRDKLEGEEFISKKKELVGKEMFFSGQIRQNKFFENLELHVQDAKHIDIDELISQLENK